VTLSLIVVGLLSTAGYSQPSSDDLLQAQPKVRSEENRDASCKIIYLGIVGGTETSNNSHSGVVQIRDLLRGPAYPGVCAKSVTPYVWRSGFNWIMKHFPSRQGSWTTDELEGAPRIILVGHSLGGWAVLSVARNLKRKGIPVELCVQIDSVGITDHTVPSNVKAAAIFHANDVMFLLTTKTIKRDDPSHTKLVENTLISGAGHWSITRAPRIRSLVICTVEGLGAGQGQSRNSASQSGSG
jgi:hypothetical protein